MRGFRISFPRIHMKDDQREEFFFGANEEKGDDQEGGEDNESVTPYAEIKTHMRFYRFLFLLSIRVDCYVLLD